jgi:hypothetical protein
MPTRHQLSRHPDHVKAIGMMALETVDLELELTLLFSRMLGLSYTVAEAIYMTPKSEQARLDILRNAAEALFASHPRSKQDSSRSIKRLAAKKQVLSIVGRAEKYIMKRNRAMHDEWYVISKTREIKRMQVDGRINRVGTPIPITELRNDVRSLRLLIDEATKLAKEFAKKPPSMISTPQRQLYKTQ